MFEHFELTCFIVADPDGSFDILKYTDPDLDLGSDDKTIFDDLVEDTKHKDGGQKMGDTSKERKESEKKKKIEGKA